MVDKAAVVYDYAEAVAMLAATVAANNVAVVLPTQQTSECLNSESRMLVELESESAAIALSIHFM